MAESGEYSNVLVSIIIPFIDEIQYLEEAVDSCLNQDLDSFEIIIVCNHTEMISQDQKRNSLSSPFIRWFHEPALGSANARNKGLAASKGKWIQYLDVDDLIKPSKIRSQITSHDADIIVSPHTYRYLDQVETPSAWQPEDIWCGLLAGRLGSTSSMLWRRDSLNAVGGWAPEYPRNQEYELIFRMLREGFTIKTCDENLTIVRERTSGSITKNTMHHAETGIRLRENIWNSLVISGQDTPQRFDAFRGFIFKNLRALYISDPKLALSIHAKYFSDRSFRPDIPRIPLYGLIYRVLGFQRTERLTAFYRHIRKKYLKKLPVNK